jgi:hypothetical protein
MAQGDPVFRQQFQEGLLRDFKRKTKKIDREEEEN